MNTSPHPRLRLASTLWLTAFVALGIAATPGALAATAPRKQRELAEALDDLGLVYESKTNPVLQELWLLGRYHGQKHWADGSAADDEDWENRRFRVGTQARLFERLTIHAQMVSGTDMDPFYGGFTELWVGWRFHEAVVLTVGQQKHRFTHDRNISSRYLNYLERGQLTNQFTLDYTPAVTLSGRFGNWSYYTGLFSNETGRDIFNSFAEYDSGYSYLTTVTRDLGSPLGMDGAFLNAGYVFSDANERATNMNQFDHGLSAALILTEGSFSLVTEAIAGFGSDDADAAGSNAAGINVQPGWYVTDEIQLVARYQISGSNDDAGLRAQRRYEAEVDMSRGDVYQAGYFGVNYHVFAHRLKLMGGIEYSTLGGEDAWTASFAVRFFFGPHSRGPFPMAQVLPGTWD